MYTVPVYVCMCQPPPKCQYVPIPYDMSTFQKSLDKKYQLGGINHRVTQCVEYMYTVPVYVCMCQPPPKCQYVPIPYDMSTVPNPSEMSTA